MGLTIMAVLYGMMVGVPLDSSSSTWDATTRAGKTRLHSDMKSEDPYLTVITHPCGPWGNWSRFNMSKGGPAEATVLSLREEWRPLLKLVNRTIVDRVKAKRHVFVGQPLRFWQHSRAWIWGGPKADRRWLSPRAQGWWLSGWLQRSRKRPDAPQAQLLPHDPFDRRSHVFQQQVQLFSTSATWRKQQVWSSNSTSCRMAASTWSNGFGMCCATSSFGANCFWGIPGTLPWCFSHEACLFTTSWTSAQAEKETRTGIYFDWPISSSSCLPSARCCRWRPSTPWWCAWRGWFQPKSKTSPRARSHPQQVWGRTKVWVASNWPWDQKDYAWLAHQLWPPHCCHLAAHLASSRRQTRSYQGRWTYGLR